MISTQSAKMQQIKTIQQGRGDLCVGLPGRTLPHADCTILVIGYFVYLMCLTDLHSLTGAPTRSPSRNRSSISVAFWRSFITTLVSLRAQLRSVQRDLSSVSLDTIHQNRCFLWERRLWHSRCRTRHLTTPIICHPFAIPSQKPPQLWTGFYPSVKRLQVVFKKKKQELQASLRRNVAWQIAEDGR